MKYLVLFLFTLNVFADTLYKCGISNIKDADEIGYFVMSEGACDAWFSEHKFDHECVGGGCIQFKETPTSGELTTWEEVTEIKD